MTMQLLMNDIEQRSSTNSHPELFCKLRLMSHKMVPHLEAEALC